MEEEVTYIWGEPVMLEDKADAVMFVIGMLRRLQGSYAERQCFLHSADVLEDLLKEEK